MNDLNGWLILVAFLAGVTFTLLWSLRKVTHTATLDPAADDAAQAEDSTAAVAPISVAGESALLAAAVSHDDTGIDAVTPVPADGPSSIRSSEPHTDLDDISWWDRAFVAHRPAPAMSATELDATTREFSTSAGLTITTPGLIGPAGERIKGSRESMLYHTIASPYYGRTQAEEWFTSEAAAEAAGYTRWDRRKLAATNQRNGAATAPAETDTPAEPAPAAAPNGKATRNGTDTLNGAGDLNGAGKLSRTAKRNGTGKRNSTGKPNGTGKPNDRGALNGAPVEGSTEHGSIKGNRGSMLYHTPESPYYGRTKAEEWFSTEDEAAAAGYRRWDFKRAARR